MDDIALAKKWRWRNARHAVAARFLKEPCVKRLIGHQKGRKLGKIPQRVARSTEVPGGCSCVLEEGCMRHSSNVQIEKLFSRKITWALK